jgi:hypothetical protein
MLRVPLIVSQPFWILLRPENSFRKSLKTRVSFIADEYTRMVKKTHLTFISFQPRLAQTDPKIGFPSTTLALSD